MQLRVAFSLTLRGVLLGLLCFLITFGPSLAQRASAGDLDPRGVRGKIDRVKIKQAPEIRIFSTFLDANLPVKPENIGAIDVFCSGDPIDEDVEVKAFQDLEDESLDLAVVVPVSNHYPPEIRDMIKATVAEVLGQVRETDRVAAFIDDGRGILSTGLGSAAGAAGAVDGTVPFATATFPFSGLDRAILSLNRDGDTRNKRAIILITDGSDDTLNTPLEVRNQIQSFIRYANESAVDGAPGSGIMIYVVMYKPLIKSMRPLFEGLARKTRGTYREANNTIELSRAIKLAFGEIYGQLALDFTYGSLDEGDSCAFSVRFHRSDGDSFKTESFNPISFEKVGMTLFWIIFWIIILIILLILLIILIRWIIRKVREKREAKKAEKEGEEGEEDEEDGEKEEGDDDDDDEAAEEEDEPPAKEEKKEEEDDGAPKPPKLAPPKRHK